MKAYSLQRFDKRGFYGNAKVIEEDDAEKLISYNSCICIIRKKGEDDVDVVIYDFRDYAGKSLRQCRSKFGIIEGVTDKEYFTNSNH